MVIWRPLLLWLQSLLMYSSLLCGEELWRQGCSTAERKEEGPFFFKTPDCRFNVTVIRIFPGRVHRGRVIFMVKSCIWLSQRNGVWWFVVKTNIYLFVWISWCEKLNSALLFSLFLLWSPQFTMWMQLCEQETVNIKNDGLSQSRFSVSGPKNEMMMIKMIPFFLWSWLQWRNIEAIHSSLPCIRCQKFWFFIFF